MYCHSLRSNSHPTTVGWMAEAVGWLRGGWGGHWGGQDVSSRPSVRRAEDVEAARASRDGCQLQAEEPGPGLPLLECTVGTWVGATVGRKGGGGNGVGAMRVCGGSGSEACGSLAPLLDCPGASLRRHQARTQSPPGCSQEHLHRTPIDQRLCNLAPLIFRRR